MQLKIINFPSPIRSIIRLGDFFVRTKLYKKVHKFRDSHFQCYNDARSHPLDYFLV